VDLYRLEESDERLAAVAQAKTRSELAPVFADRPEPHAIPAAPVALTKARADWRQVRQHSTGPMGRPLFGRS